MTRKLNSWNTQTREICTKNLSSKILTLTKEITLSIIVIISVQWISEEKFWIPKTFALGWTVEKIIEEIGHKSFVNPYKVDIKENWPSYIDEFVEAEKQGEKLVINLKKHPDIHTIISRSNFIWFSKKYNDNLVEKWSIAITEHWWIKTFQIIKPLTFEEVANKTIKQFDFSMQNAVYMILLQNYIQSKAMYVDYDRVLIYPEYYSNKKRWRIDSESIFIKQDNWQNFAVKYLNNGDPIITKEPENLDYSWINWRRKSKKEHSKSLIPSFLWLEEQIFWLPHDKIFVQFMFWKENLKSALDNWFSFWIYSLRAEEFQNLIMKTFVSGSKQINIKHYEILKKFSIKYIEINKQ